MPRITKVYTRTGDAGTTALGGGQRIEKDAPRIECFGTVDELNSAIGSAIASSLDLKLAGMLRRIQNDPPNRLTSPEFNDMKSILGPLQRLEDIGDPVNSATVDRLHELVAEILISGVVGRR